MIVQESALKTKFDLKVFARQVRTLTVANMKSRYRKTVMGFIWVVLNPLIMFGVQSLVFGRFLRIQIPNYSLFLLSGLLPWIFIQQSIDMCTGIFVTSSRLLKSFPVHPLVYLASQILDNLVNFTATFLLLLIPLMVVDREHSQGVFLLPLAILSMTFGVIGICWLLATTQVFLRDTRFLVGFVMSVAFFLTPVFYSPEYIPQSIRWITWVNPFYYLINPFQVAIYHFSTAIFFNAVVKSFGVSALCLGAAFLIWNWKKNAIYFNL